MNTKETSAHSTELNLAYHMSGYTDIISVEDLFSIGIYVEEIAMFVGTETCSDSGGDGDQDDPHTFYVRLQNPMSLKDLHEAWDRVQDPQGYSKTPTMRPCVDDFTLDSEYRNRKKVDADCWLHSQQSVADKPPPAADKPPPAKRARVPVEVAVESMEVAVESVVLNRLATFPEGIVAARLADALGMSKQAVNRELYQLEKAERVQKIAGYRFGQDKGKPVWVKSQSGV
ncbi:hypothetical protein T484DRAFT_1754201 [Baffinella frigidus]|nr:hypothetical protein T484DRAFT_1754201 [Cryptophyta sp. CCMP2293]